MCILRFVEIQKAESLVEIPVRKRMPLWSRLADWVVKRVGLSTVPIV